MSSPGIGEDLTVMPQSQLRLHPEPAQRVLRMGGWTSTGDAAVRFCCRPPDEEEQVDEVFFGHLEETSHP